LTKKNKENNVEMRL